MTKFELLCITCRNARKSGSKVLGCRSIGDPVLVWRYGNKCRRYSPKPGNSPDGVKVDSNQQKSLFD